MPADPDSDSDYLAFLGAFAQGRVSWLPPPPEGIVFIEDDDEEDEDFNEEDEDDDDDDEEEESVEEDDEEIGYSTSISPSRVFVSRGSDGATTSYSQGVVVENDEGKCKENQNAAATVKDEGGGGDGEQWSRSEIDGLFCPICMEAWTGGGDHQVCCLPCGHVYGMSCIKKWLRQHKTSGKCPQCNRKCTLKDVRVLYASRIVVVDEEIQKKVQHLEARNASLEKECVDWCKKELVWQRKEADLSTQVDQLRERVSYLEGLMGNARSRPSVLLSDNYGHNFGSKIERHRSLAFFALQKDLKIDGARLFDVDVVNQYTVVARRLSGMGGAHVLTKMSLLAPYDKENCLLPVGTKAVKDLHLSPHARLVLLASLGKKLSVISMESNNAILSYDLPSAAWSCSWDSNNSHSMYAGLQNGKVLQFDMRQTLKPVQSMTGLTGNPIHTLHALSADPTIGSGVRSVLSASSMGLCQWIFGGSEERPSLVPESENQGVCISLAYGPRSDNIIASFRPKIESSGDVTVSQQLLSPSTSLMGQGIQGSHVLYKRIGSRYQYLGSTLANVNDIRLPKSAIIDSQSLGALYASGDEVTGDLILQELPSFNVLQKFKSPSHPIRDLKYIDMPNFEMLCCLNEDRLQLFSGKPL